MADRSVLKALSILDTLGSSGDGMTLTELSNAVGFPASTTHRLLATLASQGYVQKESISGRYVLGSKILRLQAVTSNRQNLTRTAFPFLRKLVHDVEETANMGTLSDGRVVYLESLAADRAVGLYTPPGTIAPAHCTAMGKVLLAHLPDADLDSWLAQYSLSLETPQSVTGPERLKETLSGIRESGYALDNEEWVSGVRCVAGPVRDYTGRVIAAVSVSIPSARLIPEREPTVIEMVTRVCDEISAGLGYQ